MRPLGPHRARSGGPRVAVSPGVLPGVGERWGLEDRGPFLGQEAAWYLERQCPPPGPFPMS